MSACADVLSFIESKTSEVQTSHVGFTSEVSDYLVVHMGPEHQSFERERGVEKGSGRRFNFQGWERSVFNLIIIGTASKGARFRCREAGCSTYGPF